MRLVATPCRALRHARPCAGHPRLKTASASKTWMAGTSPAMTKGEACCAASEERAGECWRPAHVRGVELRPGLRGVKTHNQDRREDDEQRQDGQLRDDERRLGLRWRQRIQPRNLSERLHDADEDVEIEGSDGGRDVDPSPWPAQVKRVQG